MSGSPKEATVVVGVEWIDLELGEDAVGVLQVFFLTIWTNKIVSALSQCRRLLSPPSDFPSSPFGEQWHSMGLAGAYGPFRPAVYHPFVLREAG